MKPKKKRVKCCTQIKKLQIIALLTFKNERIKIKTLSKKRLNLKRQGEILCTELEST